MDFMDTVKGSLLEGFYPAGWDMAKIDKCCRNKPEDIFERQSFWHKDFNPIQCENIYEFDTLMGHEIALQIKKAKDKGEKLAMILPVGPMGMYRWAVYFLKEWTNGLTAKATRLPLTTLLHSRTQCATRFTIPSAS